jgi:hypothetical protein
VEGYGEAHNDITSVKWFTQSDTEFAWAEYVYVLGDKAIFAYKIEGDKAISFIGEHRYEGAFATK